MRIIIDTGVLFYPRALRELAEFPDDIILPAVAYAERVRQLCAKGHSADEFDLWLQRNSIDVEAFDRVHARRVVPRLTSENAWIRLARDAMIAGHVGSDDVLWTTNPKDFLAMGLSRSQVWGVAQSPPSPTSRNR